MYAHPEAAKHSLDLYLFAPLAAALLAPPKSPGLEHIVDMSNMCNY